MGFEEEDGRFDPQIDEIRARLLKIGDNGPLGPSLRRFRKTTRLILGGFPPQNHKGKTKHKILNKSLLKHFLI